MQFPVFPFVSIDSWSFTGHQREESGFMFSISCHQAFTHTGKIPLSLTIFCSMLQTLITQIKEVNSYHDNDAHTKRAHGSTAATEVSASLSPTPSAKHTNAAPHNQMQCSWGAAELQKELLHGTKTGDVK